MRSVHKLLATITAACLLTACAGAPVSLGTRITDVPVGDSRPITAEACGMQLLLFIPIGVNSRLERAYSSLQSQAAGAVITDVQVKERWVYRFVGTSYCTELQASAVQPR